MRPKPLISLRPHHVLCAIGFRGEGYSDAFVANMHAIITDRLRAPGGRDERIRITFSADAICAPCPHRCGLGCNHGEKIEGLDARHAEALGLNEGDIMTWGEAQDRAIERATPDAMETLCSGCQWLSLGICQSALHEAQRTAGQADLPTEKAAPDAARPPIETL